MRHSASAATIGVEIRVREDRRHVRRTDARPQRDRPAKSPSRNRPARADPQGTTRDVLQTDPADCPEGRQVDGIPGSRAETPRHAMVPGVGLGAHFFYRYMTRGWTEPWGGWNDVEAARPRNE